MGALTCLAAYFLGKEIIGDAVGIFSALLIAINPAHINRTTLGFFDTENIGLFCMVLLPIFLLRSFNKNRKHEVRIIYGVLSGLTLGYIYASWGAAKYLNGLIVFYMLILMYTERFENRHLTSYCLTIGVGYFVMSLVPRLGVSALFSLDNLIGFGMVIVMIIYQYLKEKVDIQVISNISGAIIVLGVLAIFILPALGIDIPIGLKFLKAINPFTSGTTPLYQSIAENRVPAWISFLQDFGIVLMLGVIGVYFALQNQNEKTIYLLVFFLTALYFAGIMSRLSQILAIPGCIMGAYGLVELTTPFYKLTSSVQDSRIRRRKQVFGMDRNLGLIFIIIILLTIFPTTWKAIRAGDAPTSLASSAIGYKFDGSYIKDWPEALDWITNNVSDNEVICSWWDYGYWIQAMSGKITMADGSTSNYRQISNIGKIMMLSQEESIEILKMYDADYILVFYVFDPEDPGRTLSVGDDVKWSWMVQIGGLNITDYRDPENYNMPTQTFYNSTIAKLMYGGWDTQYFTKAYFSPSEYVRIFKINYP
jgi:dolichyl-diphosphooligosaccharide--protein glycosyltransferase